MFFYPVGNTSPIFLLQHVPPEDDADILLLGCGDPRNILYSLYAAGEDTNSDNRKLDFTCCDFEPAVIARNILLLTLISDGVHAKTSQNLWNIFYHFFLDEHSLALLHTQSRQLADASTSLDTWNASKYSHFLDIGNSFTLRELHRHWAFYAETKEFTPTRRGQLKESFVSGLEKVQKERRTWTDLTASRSAGPAILQAAMSGAEASSLFWKTGTTYTSKRDIDAATEVNPTFAYAMGDEGFMPHYGTNILAAFHLAPLFATASLANVPPLDQVYDGVRDQFRAWCTTFYNLVSGSASRIKIRVVVADVLAFCQALRFTAERHDPSTYPRVSSWRAPLLVLDGKDYASNAAPLTFDVIDTSNLFDHIGSINMLVATVPLLKRTPSASLFTETLLSSGEDPIVSFASSLCGDVTALSLLFDLTPTAHLSGYNTQSNIHELLGYHTRGKESAQYHERLVWKIPSHLAGAVCRPVAVDPAQLAQLLFGVYHRMFANENVSDYFRRAVTKAKVQSLERLHYCRKSFAELVRCLMDRVSVNWNDVFDHFERHITGDDQLLMGMNYYQDFMTQLHLSRVWTIETLLPGNPRLVANKAIGPFRDWSSVPPVVCVAFVVPRSKLAPLEEEGAPGNPVLAVELGTASASNFFSSIEPMFGALIVSGSGEQMQATVDGDPKGKQGKSDVIVSLTVASWLLALDPAEMVVRLVVVTTPSSMVLTQKLGLRMAIHEVPLTDRNLVYVLRERPSVEGVRATIPYAPQPGLAPTPAPITLSANSTTIDKMTRRTDIVEPKAKEALARKDTPVTTSQAGPCEIELSIGSAYHERLAFPYPVDATQSKLRVARQSSWVEVVASPCLLGHVGAPIGTRFPIAMQDHKPIPWTIHRVNLDRLPILKTTNVDKARLEWINPHVSHAFSDREKRTRETETMDAIAHVKDSMHSILVQVAGIQGQKQVSVFGLNRTSGGGIDTLLFITNIRLDVAAHTIVADAHVMPLHTSFLHNILPRVAEIRDLCQVNVTAEECTAWKYLLPSLTERCRTWNHTPTCAYSAPGARIPLATEHGEVPICACGKGKVSDAFRARKEWAPFLPYVTRIALGPLFAVSFLESVAGELKELKSIGSSSRSAVTPGSARPQGGQAKVTRCGACKAAVANDRPMVCSRCKKVAYCSRDCQTKDWKLHKRSCTAV